MNIKQQIIMKQVFIVFEEILYVEFEETFYEVVEIYEDTEE